ncbi:hypothetical protein [Marinoscillum furvescens]|uniref:Cytochrome B n=1 Tax=Marinoscillum furvescens DSM 4134 TaxID=1122208 RepID=A0A3D9KXL1_MARFU|nr:hypothetical protein [Marinoscillum furvescens]RED91766.1 hypothetical protein C7460_1361 [Marinoscillum furvescens DSM 4134]
MFINLNLYTALLHTHSGLRWLLLVLAVIVTFKSFLGMFGNPKYGKIDNIFAASFVGTVHLQVLIGLILYVFLSPLTQSAFADFGAAMKNAELRFWAVEHITGMVIAAVLAQVGRSKSKKTEDVKKKYRFQAIFFALSLLIIVLSIPWDRF